MTVFNVYHRNYVHHQYYKQCVYTARTEEEAKEWIARQKFECWYEKEEQDLRPDRFDPPMSSNCDNPRPHLESWQREARRPTIWDMH